MRQVVVQMGITLDGFVEARKFPGGTAIHVYRPGNENR